jgi:hypothetical protein
MTEPTDSTDELDAEIENDPDADPGNLNPRDTRGQEDAAGDPDADPGNLNPRDDRPDS